MDKLFHPTFHNAYDYLSNQWVDPWWRHGMETPSTLLALWEGNPPVARWFPQQCVAYFPYCWPEPIVDKRLDAYVMSLKCRPVAFHCLCTIFFPFNNSICYLINNSHLKRDCPLYCFYKHTSTICCQTELVNENIINVEAWTRRHWAFIVKRISLNENFGIPINILLRHVSKGRIDNKWTLVHQIAWSIA